MNSKKRYQLLAGGVLLLTGVVCSLVFIVPLPHVKNLAAVESQTVILLAASTVTIGATSLFLSGLRGFKTSLRVAYILLTLGLVLYSLAALQLPVVSLFEGWASSWWSKSGLIVVPFLVATVMMYLGMRRFVRLLEIRSVLTSFLFVSGLAIAGTFVGYVVGHYFSVNRGGFDAGAYPAVSAWTAIYSTFAMLLARAVLRRIGQVYKNASWWLFVALAVSTLSGWHQFFLTLFINIDTTYFMYGWSFWPVVLSSVLFLRAGYAFDLLSIDTSNSKGALEPVAREAVASDYMDSIVAVSKLASRVEEVDPILDDLREMTATESSAVQLSPESKQRLLALYAKLEQYLLHNDPLRTFTVEEVRSRVSPAFRVVLEHRAAS